MESEDLKKTLSFLANSQNNYDFGDDAKKIKYLYTELEKMQKNLPTIDKLNELQKIEVELETRYEIFYELNNYFDPLYIFISDKIHKENIKKIRQENRKKREIN